MGAATLIESLRSEPRFRAVVAECPFATFCEIARDRLTQHGVPVVFAGPLVEGGFLYARIRYGIDLDRASPVEALRRSATPLLLIHGTADTNIPIRHSRELPAARPQGTGFWEVEGAGHVSSLGGEGPAYARRVLAFLTAH